MKHHILLTLALLALVMLALAGCTTPAPINPNDPPLPPAPLNMPTNWPEVEYGLVNPALP